MTHLKQRPLRIAITPGEPAGIGPDIVLQLAQRSFPAELVVIADPDMMQERAKKLNLKIKFHEYNPKSNQKHKVGTLTILPVRTKVKTVPGMLNKKNSAYVVETLKIATQGCLKKQFSALVTGPVHKGVINDAGIKFSGHTEFLAKKAKVKNVVMMLMAKKLRIALVTTHLPLAKVPKAITKEKLQITLKIVYKSLQKDFSIADPHIFVAGLNPHAGEDGKLGNEEQKIIIPVIDKLQKTGMKITGPLPADTLFLPKYLKSADAFLMMYHDQGLPVLKFYDFKNAVNITLGLPFIRTSVDHGTALEIAGTGKADVNSLFNAIKTAIHLTNRN